jgi:hypothetical protein
MNQSAPETWDVTPGRAPTAKHRHPDGRVVEAEAAIIMLRPSVPGDTVPINQRFFHCDCGESMTYEWPA